MILNGGFFVMGRSGHWKRQYFFDRPTVKTILDWELAMVASHSRSKAVRVGSPRETPVFKLKEPP